MKNLQMVSIVFLLLFALNFVTAGNSLVSADDDFEDGYEFYEEGDEGEDSPYEEIGELAG